MAACVDHPLGRGLCHPNPLDVSRPHRDDSTAIAFNCFRQIGLRAPARYRNRAQRAGARALSGA